MMPAITGCCKRRGSATGWMAVEESCAAETLSSSKQVSALNVALPKVGLAQNAPQLIDHTFDRVEHGSCHPDKAVAAW